MPAAEPQLDRIQQHQRARFEGMGLSVHPMPDGRCLLVSMPLSPAPFETLAEPLKIERVVFSTVGHDRIKCLRPRPLFELPLIDIRDCKNTASIESELRRVWRDRSSQLRETSQWLTELGIDPQPNRGGTALGFTLPGEVAEARILMTDRKAAILPSAGPLSGFDLASPDERVVTLGKGLETSADLECLIAGQIDSVRRESLKRAATERERGALEGPALDARPGRVATRPTPRHQPKVLVVGPNLVEDTSLRKELKRQGYRMATARSETEALHRLAGMTPDLVVSEYALGRSDGATLVQATRGLAGIEGIPVVLLDDVSHDSRREAARAVGAAGYVILSPEKTRFVTRLGRLIEESGKRRFTRYSGRFSARLQGFDSPCVATEVGRGGVFIATDADIDLHSAMLCQIAVPELGRDLHFEGEVLYRAESQQAVPGLGLRFANISPEDEASLIEYLTRLESRL